MWWSLAWKNADLCVSPLVFRLLCLFLCSALSPVLERFLLERSLTMVIWRWISGWFSWYNLRICTSCCVLKHWSGMQLVKWSNRLIFWWYFSMKSSTLSAMPPTAEVNCSIPCSKSKWAFTVMFSYKFFQSCSKTYTASSASLTSFGVRAGCLSK